MNAQTPCTSALRTARSIFVNAQRLSTRQAASSASRPAPLLLDFLAPSWTSTPPKTSSTIARHSQRPLPSNNQPRRCFATTAKRGAIAVTNPRQDDKGNDMTITITPRAESRLKAIAEKDKNPGLALRVSVESGGCHGFQYLMKLINTSDIDKAEDTVFENADADGSFKARIVMDEPSLELLKGSSIDYTMALIGSQFKVDIPGAKSSCGCGTSFDIAA